MEFPLKPDFFPLVRLSGDEQQQYVALGDASARSLRRVLRDPSWKRVSEKSGVVFSKMLCIQEQGDVGGSLRSSGDSNQASACLLVCATALVSATISEVLDAVASPTTDEYRASMSFLHQSRFVDAVSLRALRAPSSTVKSPASDASQTSTTIKWAAFNDGKALNSAQFPEGRDYCFVEHSGIITCKEEAKPKDEAALSTSKSPIRRRSRMADKVGYDDSPKTYGYCVQESIARDREVPSLGGFGFARGSFHRTGIVVTPTDRSDIVQVSSVLQMSLDGSDSSTTKATVERLMMLHVASVGRVEPLLERRRLKQMRFVPRTDWIADESRKACAVCIKTFSLRRKHHCRACGEVVCSACAPPRQVETPSLAVTTMRICTACLVHARTLPRRQRVVSKVQSVKQVINETPRSAELTKTTMLLEPATPDEGIVEELDRPLCRLSVSSDGSNFSIAMSESVGPSTIQPWVDPFPPRDRTRGMVTSERFIPVTDILSMSSSRSSSSLSLSDFDMIEDLIILDSDPPNQQMESCDSAEQSGIEHPAVADVLKSIRRMKTDISALTTAYSADAASHPNQQHQPISTSLSTVTPDVDYISSSDDFNLLSSESLVRRRGSYAATEPHQDAGEKSRRSNMSGVSSFTGSTVLDADDYDYDEDERDNNSRSRRGSQELVALRRQVEGLHRSLALATTKLNTFEALVESQGRDGMLVGSRRGSNMSEDDPVVAHRDRAYGVLVAELHDLMGLPSPTCRQSSLWRR